MFLALLSHQFFKAAVAEYQGCHVFQDETSCHGADTEKFGCTWASNNCRKWTKEEYKEKIKKSPSCEHNYYEEDCTLLQYLFPNDFPCLWSGNYCTRGDPELTKSWCHVFSTYHECDSDYCQWDGSSCIFNHQNCEDWNKFRTYDDDDDAKKGCMLERDHGTNCGWNQDENRCFNLDPTTTTSSTRDYPEIMEYQRCYVFQDHMSCDQAIRVGCKWDSLKNLCRSLTRNEVSQLVQTPKIPSACDAADIEQCPKLRFLYPNAFPCERNENYKCTNGKPGSFCQMFSEGFCGLEYWFCQWDGSSCIFKHQSCEYWNNFLDVYDDAQKGCMLEREHGTNCGWNRDKQQCFDLDHTTEQSGDHITDESGFHTSSSSRLISLSILSFTSFLLY